jgi:sec-independent protein translocase protein TatB
MAVIALIAVLVFGPEKLPEFARQAGRFLHRMRAFARATRDDLRTELGPAYADLELRDLDPRTIVRRHIVEGMEEAEEQAQPRSGRTRPLAEGEVPPYDAEAT